MGQVSIFIIKITLYPYHGFFRSSQIKKKQFFSHQILDILGFGGDEGGGDAAVKRQAEGFANPMYQLANLMGQVIETMKNTNTNTKNVHLSKESILVSSLKIRSSN